MARPEPLAPVIAGPAPAVTWASVTADADLETAAAAPDRDLGKADKAAFLSGTPRAICLIYTGLSGGKGGQGVLRTLLRHGKHHDHCQQ